MSGAILHRIYYTLKPLMPRRLRYALRSAVARRKRIQSAASWPVLPGSELPPKDWGGWPDGKKFALVLTHDVEGRHGLEQCRQLAELEMELGFRSSFNFIPKGEYTV